MCYVDGTKRYEEVFPRGDESADFLPCSMGGVLGPLPGVVGSLMSVEAIKLLTGIGEPLTNRLLLIDALTMKITTLRLKPCN
jgi:adenylyltransferase/sulfurtransferase